MMGWVGRWRCFGRDGLDASPDAVAAVYATEVGDLCRQGEARLERESPDAALWTWLERFTEHASRVRPELFRRWHDAMLSTAPAPVTHVQAAGALRDDVTALDLLRLVGEGAIAT
ncbi:MAG: hypothetical protein ACREQM_00295 [Candidatus Dormibacteraceae bacterium]